jgi:uncharacterized protein with HEPN domain
MQTTVQNAVRMGLLRQDSKGNYYDPKATTPEGPREPQESPEADRQKDPKADLPETLALSEDTQTELYEMYSKAGEMVDAFAQKTVSGTATQADIDNLGEATGRSPEEVTQAYDRIYTDHFEQFGRFVLSLDSEVDLQDFIEWTNETIPEAERTRLMQAHFAGDLSGYRGLLDEYLQANVPAKTLQRLEKDGFSFFQKGSQWMIKTPEGHEYDLKSARRMKLI